MPQKILVTGATGKQGGAVVRALLANPLAFDFHVLALTRKTTSPAAKALASNPKVTLIDGDLNDCASIFEKAGGVGSVWGVFIVTLPSFQNKVQDQETRQGNDLIDASVANEVKHIVYTSVDRGGPNESEVNATDIPHFITKYHVEKHLREKVRGTGTTYTILRPVAFFDNLKPTLAGKIFAATWHTMGTKPLQLVATKDIGVIAAQAFAASESEEYKNTAISLAGDDLTQDQANEVFWKVLGRPMPRTYDNVSHFLQWMVPEVGTMIRWFIDPGYGADVEQCKLLYKDMMSFEDYLREESGFKR